MTPRDINRVMNRAVRRTFKMQDDAPTLNKYGWQSPTNLEARIERLEAALREISQFVTAAERLTEWDSWRLGGASWPRDAYERILDWIAEEARAALKNKEGK